MKDFNFDIWRMQAQNNTRGLIEILKTGTPDLRQRAATALRAMGVGSAIPALQESLLSETDPTVRETIMTAMEALFETTDPNEAAPKGKARRIVDLIARLNSHNAEHAVRAAQGLRYLVFDELHTYRGRQGADIALLIRRCRQAF
ncbi:MAG: HEAT repeat domain-containing protein, partial [Anaerolineae bacterium]|nr:HEAT repeat domain-containing protein [Anaerolineae bacterium]